LSAHAQEYSGFNLLLVDEHALWYGSNRAAPFARALPPGVHGLSNEALDTPWPKLTRVRAGLQGWLAEGADAPVEALFTLLADRTRAEDATLPDTGLERHWERVLSAPFVQDPDYGTRCSTVLLLEASGACYLAERRFDPNGTQVGETEFQLNAGQWP
jgi:uncharacterized protein with NRDE domain